MLHAYLDESGIHADSRWCVIAGYFGSENKWNKFDAKWRSVLDSFGVEEFHAQRFWSAYDGNNISEYSGWDQGRASNFVGKLLDVIQDSNRIFPVSCSVHMDEWHKLSEDEKAYLTGAKLNFAGKRLTSGAPNKPYFLPFLTVIRTVMEYCQPGHTTNFSFDESRHFSGYASQYFKEIKTWEIGNFSRLGQISFGESKKHPGIQAADLLAYESYQYGLARLKRNLEPMNPSPVLHTAIQNIRNLKMDSKMFDQFGFDLILENLKSSQESN